jgi:hypothetical protein
VLHLCVKHQTKKMKKVFLSLLILISAKILHAQNDYDNNNGENKGFKKENVFLGGSISLGFSSGSFGIGANPEIGYSVAQWLDAGVALNVNYNSQRDYYYDVKYSSFNYGAGVFVRAYPLPFLFVQLQPEQNWISYNTKYSTLIDKQTVNATSLIGGVGYSQRVVGQASTFFMIGLDLINDVNSPYNDGYGHAQPIIRGGFDVYLHPSRKPRPVGNQL